jgi:antirestriction protein ArdC
MGEFHPVRHTDAHQRLVQRDLARCRGQQVLAAQHVVIFISASSTGLTKVYSGSPVARVSAKSGTVPAPNVVVPRTRSCQVRSASGIRSRSTGLRPSASNAARCSSVRSRS